MNPINKAKLVIEYVKSHKVAYAFIAGGLLSGTVATLYDLKAYKGTMTLPLDKILATIEEQDAPGMYFPLPKHDVTLIVTKGILND